jgi:hypothetical protein
MYVCKVSVLLIKQNMVKKKKKKKTWPELHSGVAVEACEASPEVGSEALHEGRGKTRRNLHGEWGS